MHVCVGTCVHVHVGVVCVGRGEEAAKEVSKSSSGFLFLCTLNKEVIRGHIPNFFLTL